MGRAWVSLTRCSGQKMVVSGRASDLKCSLPLQVCSPVLIFEINSQPRKTQDITGHRNVSFTASRRGLQVQCCLGEKVKPRHPSCPNSSCPVPCPVGLDNNFSINSSLLFTSLIVRMCSTSILLKMFSYYQQLLIQITPLLIYLHILQLSSTLQINSYD